MTFFRSQYPVLSGHPDKQDRDIQPDHPSELAGRGAFPCTSTHLQADMKIQHRISYTLSFRTCRLLPRPDQTLRPTGWRAVLAISRWWICQKQHPSWNLYFSIPSLTIFCKKILHGLSWRKEIAVSQSTRLLDGRPLRFR